MQAGETVQQRRAQRHHGFKTPEGVPGTSIDPACGSSQQALHFAAASRDSAAWTASIAAASNR